MSRLFDINSFNRLKSDSIKTYSINIGSETNEIFINLLTKYNRNSKFLILSKNILENKEDWERKNKKMIILNNQRDIFRESQKFKKDFTFISGSTSRVIDHIRRSHTDLAEIDRIIVFLPEESGEINLLLGDVSFIASHISNLKEIYYISHLPLIHIGNPLFSSVELLNFNDWFNKKEKKMAKIPEKTVSIIDELVRKTKDDNEPEKLSEYKKIFKKCIPFGYRGWVTAFLLKEYLSRDKSFKMPVLKDGVTLFVGIGKNRKVYPKDLIHLLINTGKIERSHIGEIRILDNYAFISIEKTSADKAIENLNGINYRGRSLNVNYAKQK